MQKKKVSILYSQCGSLYFYSEVFNFAKSENTFNNFWKKIIKNYYEMRLHSDRFCNMNEILMFAIMFQNDPVLEP